MIYVVQKDHAICDIHFDAKYRVDAKYFSQSGLVYGALPTINLPSRLESELFIFINIV
jgi:hypothetical protein